MAKELTIFSKKKRGGREEGKKGKDSLRSPPEDKSAPRGDGEGEGGVVNKMGVWIVIRIWEGGIDFSHFSF